MAGILSMIASGVMAVVAAAGLAGPLPAIGAAEGAADDRGVAGPPSLVVLEAADPDDFDPGLLISDERFYDATAMDSEQIADFLDRVPCIPADGVDCLSDYRETTPDMPSAGTGHCSAYEGDEWESAAVIIAEVARVCGINPQVLLVMLQKEQSLITRPSADGYQRAMGYACPDTADCDTRFFGFFNQVYNAAWQFRQYTLFPTERAFEVGVRDVGFNPDAACGDAPVKIRNQATANLYLYTPYQPNEAAVENLYGDGDECSAYGNRNFWRIFTDWFGDPTERRFPDWFGHCITREGGRPCLDEFWMPPTER